MSKKFTIRGRTYDLNDASAIVSIQNAVVPDNWPGNRPDGVLHFLAIQEIVGTQIRRYVAAKYQKIAKSAIAEGSDGGEAKIGVSFSFEIDFTSPLVAAVGKLKLSFSMRDVLEGKPQTVDLTQANFFETLEEQESDVTTMFDTRGIAQENAEHEQAEAEAKAKAKEATQPTADDTTVTMSLANPDGTKTKLGTLPKKRSRKKKGA